MLETQDPPLDQGQKKKKIDQLVTKVTKFLDKRDYEIDGSYRGRNALKVTMKVDNEVFPEGEPIHVLNTLVYFNHEIEKLNTAFTRTKQHWFEIFM